MTHTRQHPHTWQLLRDDYLAGQPRSVLAERYGVGESTIRDRARREGWRRVDQPPTEGPPDWDETAQSEPMRPVVAIIADAYRFADLAMRRGRPVEAQRFLSVAKGFERLNRTDPLVRCLGDYWAKEERMLLDTDGQRAEQEALADSPPPSPEPPNPPSPPGEIELAEEASPPAKPAPSGSTSDAPPAEDAEALSRLLRRRKRDRLPFHDVVAQLNRHAPLTATSAPLGSPGEHAPAHPPELSSLALAGARDPVRSPTAPFVGGSGADLASDPSPPEPT